MPIDIKFERHASAQAADACLRNLESGLRDLNLPWAAIAVETDPSTKLVTSVRLKSAKDYSMKAVYLPARDKKHDHITVGVCLDDDVSPKSQDALDLLLLDVFDYTRT